MKKVYLAGPITGQEIDSKWRDSVRRKLGVYGFETLDPLRNTDTENIEPGGLRLKDGSGIDVAQDMVDVRECDIILAHFPYNPERQSTGTLMELGAAHALGKKIVLCIPPHGPQSIRSHPFSLHFCEVVAKDLEEAIDWILENGQGG